MKFIINGNDCQALPNPQPKNKWRREMRKTTSPKALARLRSLAPRSIDGRAQKYQARMRARRELIAKLNEKGKYEVHGGQRWYIVTQKQFDALAKM